MNESERAEGLSRRDFVRGLTVAGTAELVSLRPGRADADRPLETTKLRAIYFPSAICTAPLDVAEEFLKLEGFTNVQYVKVSANVGKALTSGEADMGLDGVAALVSLVDAGAPIVVLAGVHVGCFELFATERVRAIRDLSGKTVAVAALGGTSHVFLASIAAYVGLDPRRDINFVEHPAGEAMQAFADRRVDAYLAFPPQSQELRAKKIGHVVVNSATDRPWSQYFCCMLAARKEFVRQYPVATKRALRAILKSTDLCAREPSRTARLLVEKGFAADYDYAFQALRDIPYDRWRTYDPEDAYRFYCLRLHEAGMIKASPQKIVAQGTDWRVLDELKKELKG